MSRPRVQAGPRPWKINPHNELEVMDANGTIVCECFDEIPGGKYDARLIVEAVNALEPRIILIGNALTRKRPPWSTAKPRGKKRR